MEAEDKKERRVAVILEYDVWEEDDNGETVRYTAAPVEMVVGADGKAREKVDGAGRPIRTETTLLKRATAEKLVNDGKAKVPLK